MEPEIQHGLHPVPCRVLGGERPAGVEHLPEHEELGFALAAGIGQHLRSEALPELVVDVLHGVDPEPVDAHLPDPGLVDVDHPADHLRVLGEQVVQTEEVAVVGVLTGEGGVAPVVVERDIVEPARHLEILLRGVQHRRVREGNLRVERREVIGTRVVAVVERGSGGGAVRLHVLGDVGRPGPFLVADHIGGVVGDDVEVDLHPSVVGRIDQGTELGVGAQVRVNLGEIGDPIPVVTGRRAVFELDGLVLEARRQPDRGRAQPLDVVHPVQQPGQVTAVVEAPLRGIEAVLQPVTGDPTRVVGLGAVLEPVRHDEIEVLVRDRRPQGRPRGQAVRPGVGRPSDRQQSDGQRHTDSHPHGGDATSRHAGSSASRGGDCNCA